MHVSRMNWMEMEQQAQRDDRAVLPIGSTEQHAFLSLATDALLAERVATEAAEPLGVPVFPVMPYGITPSFATYPGTVSLRIETLIAVVRDVLDSLQHSGFRRILIVNGHGGNTPIASFGAEWMSTHAGVRVRMLDWWNAPKVWAKVQEIDPVASHASWMENFPWTRIAGVAMPDTQKPMTQVPKHLDPAEVRARIGDGNFGGRYARSDEDMLAVWAVAVAEAREVLERGWS